ncbi:hypothetical protein HNQ36_003453 [Afipia massiliensis]|uniref:Uncharacterized protein n=1 Tax=Afipia massiliensis TaxID=211460 RepID=A0A840N3H4_9BRAD|nr:hypothetical protein [Afipia massiliensis]MBB5053462.1 hypothetical protein [Afipia massiliensis]
MKLAENSIETMKATPEFRTAWMAEVRKQARPLFDEKLVPSLRAMGVVDFEKAFEVWFEMEMQAAKPEDLESRINADFRSLAKGELNKQRTEADQKLNEGKDQLDGSCKKDVGSQTLRLTLAPIGWVVGNFEASKNEKNIVTQVFHAVTGIGVQAIAERGILGGDKSFVRTALEPVIGGRNGAIQRGVGDVARAFKPGNWRF